MNVAEKWNQFIAPTYSPPAIELVSGKGTRVTDSQGKSYLDFISGIAVTSLGHANEDIARAITAQLGKLGHVSNLYANPITRQLAERLIQISGMPNAKVFFCNSGAEANEAAMKFVRAAKPKSRFASLENSFHGRTIGALSLTGQEEKRRPFLPLLTKIDFIQTNSARSVNANIGKRTGGVWLELIQGEGGVVPLSNEFVERIAHQATKYSAALVIDEVQTGIGRTGDWFAYQKYNVAPDLVPIAKGLGGGLPIGALLVSANFSDKIKPGGHGSTYGGNPIAAAAALAVIDHIEQFSILENVNKQGQKIISSAKSIPDVLDVRGRGLLLGVVLKFETAKQIQHEAQERGLLANAVRPNVIRLAPPLNVDDFEVDQSLDILHKSIEQVHRG